MKFLRRKPHAYSKLGHRRKKKQVWRKPTGRDNKMREKRKGVPAVVSIGYSSGDKKKNIAVNNLKEISETKSKEVFIGNVGKKKRAEIEKIAKDRGIKILNRYLREKESTEKEERKNRYEKSKTKNREDKK